MRAAFCCQASSERSDGPFIGFGNVQISVFPKHSKILKVCCAVLGYHKYMMERVRYHNLW